MGNINTAFDADETDLFDLRADPNDVIHIQTMVKEMLGEHPLRQAGLRSEILARGAHALPGVISATYVLNQQLSNDKNRQMLGKLMAELTKSNPAALRLLVNHGIAENPFRQSRSTVLEALLQLDADAIVRDSESTLADAAMHAVMSGDQQAARQIYELLLAHNLQVTQASNACRKWLSEKLDADQAIQLMNALLRAQPDHIDSLLIDLLGQLARRTAAFKPVIKHLRLPRASDIAAAIRAAGELLSRERTGRSQAVEALFKGAVAAAIVDNSSVIPAGFAAISSERTRPALTRYWWQAISDALNQECADARRVFESDLRNLTIDDKVNGLIQLIFLSRKDRQPSKNIRMWAEAVLAELEKDLPEAAAIARQRYGEIVTGNQSIWDEWETATKPSIN